MGGYRNTAMAIEGYMDKNKCSRCGSNNLLDSRARGMEPVFSALLPVDSFRCKDCLLRGMYRVNFFTNYWRVGFWFLVLAIFLLLLFDEFKSSRAMHDTRSDLHKNTLELTSQRKQANRERIRIVESSLAQPQELVATKPQLVGSNVVSVTPTETEAISDRMLSLVESESLESVEKESADLDSVKSERQGLKLQKSTIADQDVKVQIDQDAKAQVGKTDKLELSNNFSQAQAEVEQRPEESVMRALDNWKSAWEASDVDLYLAAYSDEFEPNSNISYESWKARRSKIVGRQENRRISLKNIKTVFSKDGGRAVVDFNQAFESDSYKDNVRKRIYLKNHFDRWLIVREDVI